MLLPSVRLVRYFLLTMSVSLTLLSKCVLNELLLGEESTIDVERNTVTGGKCRPGECDDQCYPDSIMTAAGDCLCDMSKCDNGASVICGDDVVKHLVRKGTGVPGECCDVYQCVDKPDCNNTTCPVDTEECPEDSYKLPAHRSLNECCSKPQGCQCLPKPPCATADCPTGFVSYMIQKATKIPGHCCPLYSCRNPESEVAVELTHDEPVSEPHPGGCLTAVGTLVENDDETWMEDPCTTCSCQKGRKVCQASMCLVSCIKPLYITGECCPTCDASSVAMPSHCSPLTNCSLHCIHGFVQDSVGCLTCQCQQEECVLECPDGFATDEHGTKLCKCIEPSRCPSIGSCVKNKICSHGYKTDQRGCEICECDSCTSPTTCAKHCAFGYSSDEKNCTVCSCLPPPPVQPMSDAESAVAASEKTCQLDGNRLMDNGEVILNACNGYYCNNGNLFLSTSYCSEPTCVSSAKITEDGLCCRYCEGDDRFKNMINTMKCQSQNGTYFMQHDQYTFDGCIRCICYNNVGYCTKPDCPPTPCPNPLPPKLGECCPTCPRVDYSVMIEIISQTPMKCETGNYNGHIWRTSNCSSCRCYRNTTVCYDEFCPTESKSIDNGNDILYEVSIDSSKDVVTTAGTCRRYAKVGRNACCKTCIGEAKFSPADDDCIFGNQTYPAGFKWMQYDTCEYCHCLRASVQCTKIKCTLPCFAADRENGRCCCTGIIEEFGYIIIVLVAISLLIIATKCTMKQWRSSKRQMRMRNFTKGSTAATIPLKHEYKYIPTSPSYEIPLSKKLSHNGKKCSITNVI